MAWHMAARGTARALTPFPQATVAFSHGLDINLEEVEEGADPTEHDVVYVRATTNHDKLTHTRLAGLTKRSVNTSSNAISSSRLCPT